MAGMWSDWKGELGVFRGKDKNLLAPLARQKHSANCNCIIKFSKICFAYCLVNTVPECYNKIYSIWDFKLQVERRIIVQLSININALTI